MTAKLRPATALYAIVASIVTFVAGLAPLSGLATIA
jgi:hypothetical protein